MAGHAALDDLHIGQTVPAHKLCVVDRSGFNGDPAAHRIGAAAGALEIHRDLVCGVFSGDGDRLIGLAGNAVVGIMDGHRFHGIQHTFAAAHGVAHHGQDAAVGIVHLHHHAGGVKIFTGGVLGLGGMGEDLQSDGDDLRPCHQLGTLLALLPVVLVVEEGLIVQQVHHGAVFEVFQLICDGVFHLVAFAHFIVVNFVVAVGNRAFVGGYDGVIGIACVVVQTVSNIFAHVVAITDRERCTLRVIVVTNNTGTGIGILLCAPPPWIDRSMIITVFDHITCVRSSGVAQDTAHIDVGILLIVILQVEERAVIPAALDIAALGTAHDAAHIAIAPDGTTVVAGVAVGDCAAAEVAHNAAHAGLTVLRGRGFHNIGDRRVGAAPGHGASTAHAHNAAYAGIGTAGLAVNASRKGTFLDGTAKVIADDTANFEATGAGSLVGVNDSVEMTLPNGTCGVQLATDAANISVGGGSGDAARTAIVTVTDSEIRICDRQIPHNAAQLLNEAAVIILVTFRVGNKQAADGMASAVKDAVVKVHGVPRNKILFRSVEHVIGQHVLIDRDIGRQDGMGIRIAAVDDRREAVQLLGGADAVGVGACTAARRSRGRDGGGRQCRSGQQAQHHHQGQQEAQAFFQLFFHKNSLHGWIM